jgi:hypothetical protein
MRQAGKKIRRFVELEVGTALPADWMRPSRTVHPSEPREQSQSGGCQSQRTSDHAFARVRFEIVVYFDSSRSGFT